MVQEERSQCRVGVRYGGLDVRRVREQEKSDVLGAVKMEFEGGRTGYQELVVIGSPTRIIRLQ